MSGHVDRLLGVPDAEIISRIRAGDDSTYASLAKAYLRPLYLWGAQFFEIEADAEDAAVDVLMSIWLRRTEWSVKSTVEAYLFAAVRNRAISTARDESRRMRLLDERSFTDDIPGISADVQDAEVLATESDIRARLQSLIYNLPRRYRAVLELRVQRDMSYDDIAEVMGISRAGAMMAVSRALRVLRQALPPDSPLRRDLDS